MVSAGTDEQLKFLIACIRYANNGKIDFSEVAKECHIVSKGAAAKRYERMMKAHGVHQSQSPKSETPVSSCRRKRNGETSPVSAKKRKTKQVDNNHYTTADDDDDDDEGGLEELKQDTILEKDEEVARNPVIKAEKGARDESIPDDQYPWLNCSSRRDSLPQRARSQTSPESRVDEHPTQNDSSCSIASTPTKTDIV